MRCAAASGVTVGHMSVLRVYDPAECDEAGVPLDWERCRSCLPHNPGYVPDDPPEYAPGAQTFDVMLLKRCPTCGGHGSLKAAALAYVMERQVKYDRPEPPRCEGCGHPMSDGTWERDPPGAPLRRDHPEGALTGHVHWSPCDEGCRHGAPIRTFVAGVEATYREVDGELVEIAPPRDVSREFAALVEMEGSAGDWVKGMREHGNTDPFEASWRQVDVRTLGWPHDLRPERLAVLCLRCFAGRGEA